MRLSEFKTKYMAVLALYEPRNEREKELKDIIINKLYNARTMTMPYLVHTLYEVIEHEPRASDELKRICRDMIRDVASIGGEE